MNLSIKDPSRISNELIRGLHSNNIKYRLQPIIHFFFFSEKQIKILSSLSCRFAGLVSQKAHFIVALRLLLNVQNI
jgi:hypothetical protein